MIDNTLFILASGNVLIFFEKYDITSNSCSMINANSIVELHKENAQFFVDQDNIKIVIVAFSLIFYLFFVSITFTFLDKNISFVLVSKKQKKFLLNFMKKIYFLMM